MITSISKSTQDYLSRSAASALQDQILDLLMNRFEILKRQMIRDFMDHPVTIEIMLGADVTDNPSGLLGGYGGLFSFIGFDEGDDPIQPILDLLEATTIKIGRPTIDGRMYNVFLPSAADIFSVSPMPWASGRSWAKGIESGISGFGNYINTYAPSSRSGEGAQISVKLRGGTFKKTQYISALINKYTQEFQKLL